MSSTLAVAFDALDAAVAPIDWLDFDGYDPAIRLRALERLETAGRRLAVAGHDLIAGLATADPANVGGPVHKVIADWLRISCAEARRRMRDAEQLAPRITIIGDRLPGVARDCLSMASGDARPAAPPSDPGVCARPSWRYAGRHR